MSVLSYSSKFFLLKVAEKNNQFPIYCRVIVNRKKTEFSTNKFIDINKWDEGKQRPKGNPELYGYITNLDKRIHDIHSRLISDKGETSAKEIRNCLLGSSTAPTLLEYFEKYIFDIERLPEYTASTIMKFRTVKSHLKKYLKSKNIENIKITDFKKSNVYELEQYLKIESKLAVNTTSKYLKQIKTVFITAIKFDILEKNPFVGFKFKVAETNRTFLTQAELDTLEGLDLDNESLIRVRDAFIFAVYTGLRYIDIQKLSNSNIDKKPDGSVWLEITQQKTSKFHRIPLFDKAIELLNKYENESKMTEKPIPIVSNQKINSYLKVLADLCNFKKELTFHVARHTNATTILLSNNIPIEVVSKFLGHTNVHTTEIYAKITNDHLKNHITSLNQKLI